MHAYKMCGEPSMMQLRAAIVGLQGAQAEAMRTLTMIDTYISMFITTFLVIEI